MTPLNIFTILSFLSMRSKSSLKLGVLRIESRAEPVPLLDKIRFWYYILAVLSRLLISPTLLKRR